MSLTFQVFLTGYTSGWAGPAAPLRGTGHCASPGWSETRSGCKKWPRGTSWSGSWPHPVWWHVGTRGRSGSCPRTRTAGRSESPGKTPPRDSVWCRTARTWKCETFRAESSCAQKLLRVEVDLCPFPRLPLWDPLSLCNKLDLNARVRKKTASKQSEKLSRYSFTCGTNCHYPPEQVQTRR